MKSKIFFTLFLVLSFWANAQDTTKVLFVGNSLTYTNDLPNTFKGLAVTGGKVVLIDQITFGGYTLQMHFNNAQTMAKIHAQQWDYVVLQEQSQIPSMPGVRETQMYPYAIKLDSAIHVSNPTAQTLFFLTFAHQNGDADILAAGGTDTYWDMQQRLRDGYMFIADSLHAPIAPVGWAWRSVRLLNPPFDLYAPGDVVHPNINGTYLAACVFYATIFKESPIQLTFTAGIDPGIVTVLQSAASHTVMDSLNTWHLTTTGISAAPEEESLLKAAFAGDELQLWFNQQVKGDFAIRVCSVDGAETYVASVFANSVPFTIPARQWKPGVYLVEVQNSKAKQCVKVIKP